MSYKYFIYFILNELKTNYKLRKKYINTDIDTYIQNILNLKEKFNTEFLKKKIYYLELKFNKRIIFFDKEKFKLNLNNVELFDNSIFNIYYFDKTLSEDIDFSKFCLNYLLNSDIYGLSEKNILTIPFEMIEINWNNILKINKWYDIMNYFVKKINLENIINSNFEPIYKVVLQWSYYLKVLCIFNKKGYYLLELNRY
jgi:hypothetical protein